MQTDDEGFACVTDASSTQAAQQAARAVYGFGKAMLLAAQSMRMPHNGEPVGIRVGGDQGTSGRLWEFLPYRTWAEILSFLWPKKPTNFFPDGFETAL